MIASGPSRRALLTLAAAFVAPPAARAQAPAPRFGREDLERRAAALAGAPFEANPPPLPDPLGALSEEAYRAIRFRPDRALSLGPYRVGLFHLGGPFRRPVTVGTVREGVAAPVPYAASLFDLGGVAAERPLPVGLGFAGMRLHHPLNEARSLDEVAAFLGGSSFRVLGRRQRYGSSARALLPGDGEPSYFRELWVEAPEPGAERVVVRALADSPQAAGAFEFALTPGPETVVEVSAALFPRVPLERFGLGALSARFVAGELAPEGEAAPRYEAHDADGVQVLTAAGEWLWRPLRAVREREVGAVPGDSPRGYGLLQRDRDPRSYADPEGAYEARPGLWVEPQGSWGEGRLELVEAPPGEAGDSATLAWVPRAPIPPGAPFRYAHRLSTVGARALHPGAQVVATQRAARPGPGFAPWGEAPPAPGARRFLVDFAGGDLAYYAAAPDLVEAVASVAGAPSEGARLARAGAAPLPGGGWRAALDVAFEPGATADLRLFLRANGRALSETWALPWRAP